MLSKRKTILLAIFAFGSAIGYAQVGIGTTTPDASSILDIESTTQGFRSPRMTSAQRIAIVTPANGLMVFDTTVGSFYHYDTLTTSWIKMSGTKEGRLKYKLIKSTDVLATVLAAEKTAGSNTKYLLDTATLYEINGTIAVDLPIELNGAYMVGEDSGEDKLVMTANGDMFTGTTGGSLRILTLTKSGTGNLFNITGAGTAPNYTQSLILRDCIVTGCTSVGTLSNFAFVFLSIVQFTGNTNGITYNNITKLLLSNTGWFSSNTGTYEKLLGGTFGLVAKQGGFSEVTGASIGFDVAANPVVTEAVLETTIFTGTLSTGKYVNGYTVGSYAGFNFNNNWSVRSTGIPTEGDSQATGTFYMNRAGAAQATTGIGTVDIGSKLVITAGLSSNLYRFTSPSSNRLTYQGKKGRIFQVNCAVAFENVAGSGNTDYVFYFNRIPAAGGVDPQIPSESVIDTNAGYIQGIPIQGSIYLNTGDSVEVWVKRITNFTQDFRVRSFSISIK